MVNTALLLPFKHRPFRWLFAGHLVSVMGDWLDFLAISILLAYKWNLGAGAFAMVTASRMLPVALLGPLAGVWADRFDRRTIMIVTDLVQAVLVLGLIWAPNLYMVTIIVLAKTAVGTFFGPARQAALRSIMPTDDLLQARSVMELSIQVTKIMAPVLGGLLAATAGPNTAFVVNSASFLLSALFLSQLPTLRPERAEHPATERSHFWSDFWEGITYVRSRPMLKVALVGMAAGTFIIFLYDSLFPLLMQTAGLGESLLGAVVSAVGLGSVIGALVIGQWGKRLRPMATIVMSTVVTAGLVAAAGLGGLGYAIGDPAVWQIGIWFLAGACGVGGGIYMQYIVQIETPPHLMGRVTAIASTLQNIFPFIAPTVGALLATLVGIGGVFVIAGVAMALLAVGLGLYVNRNGITVPEQTAQATSS